MKINENISASLMYGAVVAFTTAAAVAPVLLDNPAPKAASSQKTAAHCRDIINGTKQANMLEYAGCYYGHDGINLYMPR